jgi:hypothetical protein
MMLSPRDEEDFEETMASKGSAGDGAFAIAYALMKLAGAHERNAAGSHASATALESCANEIRHLAEGLDRVSDAITHLGDILA